MQTPYVSHKYQPITNGRNFSFLVLYTYVSGCLPISKENNDNDTIVKEKGAGWNQKVTKSQPKGKQNASTKQDREKASN